MAKEESINDKEIFKCKKCGLAYKEKKFAEKCQAWCEKHNSCNLKYAKFAIKQRI